MKVFSTLSLATLLFFFAATTTLAQTTASTDRTTRPSPAARAQAVSDRRLQACQSRQEAVTNRMSGLVRFANNMLEKFNAISLRVQAFYTSKVLPRGITVANYDALLQEVADKKAVVETELATAQSVVAGFSCDDGEMRDEYNEFREAMRSVKNALQEYRTAIRNLIQAVHSAVEDAAPTPTPSPTPET